jgi:hypothetical protein
VVLAVAQEVANGADGLAELDVALDGAGGHCPISLIVSVLLSYQKKKSLSSSSFLFLRFRVLHKIIQIVRKYCSYNRCCQEYP